jgi:hypothetical protein
MTFIDRIADARDIADVFDLVNEFIVGLHHVHQEIPVALRLGRVVTADDCVPRRHAREVYMST